LTWSAKINGYRLPLVTIVGSDVKVDSVDSVSEGSDSPACTWNQVILLSHGRYWTTRLVRINC